jgi:D-alanyl-lipoteichoic acid acyltransferase DltB (MBOAT superfamily)
MLFNSIEFLFFLPVVTALYFALPQRYRNSLLLAASYYFYMCWKAEYILLITASTLVGYFAAIQSDRHREKSKKKFYLLVSLTFNLGLLFFFKYFNFFNDNVRAVFDSVNIFYNVPAFNVLLPVGISFYTFQLIGYSIDVYRGEHKAEKNLGVFALYVSFFPQLVAGPIERCSHLLPQFFEKHELDYQRVTDGLKLITWGFFKKLVIADRVALLVNQVYNNPTEHIGSTFLLATVFFAFQVYCDFSAYTDIAIGAGKIMGFELMQNFNRPYSSKSVSEFWKRWHISLSNWIRDYLFFPILLSKKYWGNWGVAYASLISFTLVGLWHGAAWTFVIFGLLHGLALGAEVLTKKTRLRLTKRIPRGIYSSLCLVSTFSFVNFTLIFFRANTISDAFYIVRQLFFNFSFSRFEIVGLNRFELTIAVFSILIMELVQWMQKRENIWQRITGSPRRFRWPAYYALIFSIILLGEFNQTAFIYFQF